MFLKIDWVLVNSEWIANIPDYSAHFLPEGISNHYPIRISLINDPRRKKASFKFCNIWISHFKFLNLVTDVWEQEVVGYQIFSVVRKLRH